MLQSYNCLRAFVTGLDVPTQCDQMVGLFFNIWPLTTMKICAINNMPKLFQNFAKY